MSEEQASGSPRKHRDGFEQIPDSLVTENLTVRCMAPELGDDLCDGWVESVEIDSDDVRMDGYGLLHFPEHVPTECPSCGGRMLAYNGVEVTFHV